MKKVIVTIAIVALAALWIAGPVKARNNGIVALAGYKHAVAMCGHEGMATYVTGKNGTVVFMPQYTLVVNEGHQWDKEVNTLKAAALVKCGGY